MTSANKRRKIGSSIFIFFLRNSSTGVWLIYCDSTMGSSVRIRVCRTCSGVKECPWSLEPACVIIYGASESCPSPDQVYQIWVRGSPNRPTPVMLQHRRLSGYKREGSCCAVPARQITAVGWAICKGATLSYFFLCIIGSWQLYT